MTSCVCTPGQKSGRSDQKCSECQRQICRASKRGKNRYKTHGPCMKPASRLYWRSRKIFKSN